ncbi:hypothetical protein AURDEDRAFT_170202 [Auricularia subglabra TFB-10046 SS5]|nr:hypothetical protein AURDEDRAFT_170202 [Auricularia subglabra TFB-10046 SS5]
MQLSAASRDMHAALLGIPDIWTELYTDSHLRQRGPAVVDTHVLASYLERSGHEALSMSVFTMYELLILEDQASVLASCMRRMSRLCVEFCYDTPYHTHAGWQCLNQVLAEPAPLLTVLDLTVFGGPIDDPADRAWAASVKLTLGDALFAGDAPRFQACRLRDVRLPPREHCGPFINVTTFCYDVCGEILSDDLVLIAEVMPQLETLELAGIVVWGDSSFCRTDGDDSSGPTFKSLRVLQLAAAAARLQSSSVLFRIVPFQQLGELWLIESDRYSGESFLDLSALYPAMDSLSLSIHSHRLFGHLTCEKTSATPTRMVANKLPYTSSLSATLARYPPLTHLEIHEIFLNNDIFGQPPPLPGVTTLVVHLARCIDWCYHAWELSGVIPNPDSPWSLSALRDVHVTAAQTSSGEEAKGASRCGYPNGPCMCDRPLRVAVREIACWVRAGINFDAERLDSISFFGVQVIDGDFCAAWNELLEIATYADISDIRAEGDSPQSREPDEQWLRTYW